MQDAFLKMFVMINGPCFLPSDAGKTADRLMVLLRNDHVGVMKPLWVEWLVFILKKL